MASFRSDVEPILDEFCYDCHGLGTNEGGVTLDEFTAETIADTDLWLRVLRKRNCAVVFVSQSLTEVFNSPQRDLLLESCRTKIFLPNPEARSSQTSQLYRKLGLNETQVELIAHAIPKRHYYYVSELGRRMLDLGLGPETLSFIGISGTEEIEQLRKLCQEHGDQWPAAWLEQRGLEEAAIRWKQLSKEYSRAAN